MPQSRALRAGRRDLGPDSGLGLRDRARQGLNTQGQEAAIWRATSISRLIEIKRPFLARDVNRKLKRNSTQGCCVARQSQRFTKANTKVRGQVGITMIQLLRRSWRPNFGHPTACLASKSCPPAGGRRDLRVCHCAAGEHLISHGLCAQSEYSRQPAASLP